MSARHVAVSGTATAFLAAFAAAAAAPAAAGPRFEAQQVWTDLSTVAADAAVGDISRIIYINRCVGGCEIAKAGVNDSRENTSTIPTANGISTLTEFSGTDLTFDAVVDCVRELYAPYDVEVVTEDPGTVIHHEHIFAGLPGEIGREGAAGIAPSNCEPLNNVISYTFANLNPADVEDLCWTVAQESAHSFGLPNHSFDCSDPMTYLAVDPDDGACGRKYFRNELFQCGEFEPAPCACGASGQNSHFELTNVFGPGTPPDPSTVEIIIPADGEEVMDGFDVFFTAQNPRQVARVELVVNGTVYDELPAHPYSQRNDAYNFTVPDMPDGYLDVEIIAYDDLGTPGGAAVTVLKGEPCGSADSCFDFQACEEGRCVYPEPAGMLGDECAYEEYCLEGTCYDNDGDRRCATSCNAQVAGSCIEGFECVGSGENGACFPETSAGGCCAVAGGQGRGLPVFAFALFAAAVLALRRRRVG